MNRNVLLACGLMSLVILVLLGSAAYAQPMKNHYKTYEVLGPTISAPLLLRISSAVSTSQR